MFFSKITIKSESEIFKLANSNKNNFLYSAHQLLWKAFPEDKNAKRDFLFRKEEKSNLPSFYCVSSRKPTNNNLFNIKTKEYNPQMTNGTKLSFSLVVNPIVSIRDKKDKTKSTKHDVWMNAKKEGEKKGLENDKLYSYCEEVTKKWLIERAERLGFSINYVNIDCYHKQSIFKKRNNKKITFSSINFDGTLTITNSERFNKMLFEGIGKSKAFGCGMMMVRKV